MGYGMHALHSEKPPLSSGPSSQNIDLIIWDPATRDPAAWLQSLVDHRLGERSETVVWLTKFTVRLAMWRGGYLALLADDDWQEALGALEHAIREVYPIYRPRRIEYDTRAFTVGLVKRVHRHTRPLSVLSSGTVRQGTPVWWRLTP